MDIIYKEITWLELEKIYEFYNPFGNKHYFLVDEFLEWTEKSGDYYWIWDGAVERSNVNEDPRNVIRELPFINISETYRELLKESWLNFLNSSPEKLETLWKEYKLTKMYGRNRL